MELHKLDGIVVRVYSPEKALADCFKFRASVGLDTALEALRLYRERKVVRTEDVLHYARVCRVEKIMAPYLALL
jgi:hypothetical protein